MVCHECGEAFDSHETDFVERFEPMKLFLSYGHPEIEIVQRIERALKERGHKVWIDTSEIKSGNDWREKIVKGVHDSNGVIACLSRHSVRNPGVCLDELAIAVGIHGGNVKTVLLGSEGEIEPPASVTHIQWIDMHDWKERLNCGPEAFDGWFDAHMQELFEAIENNENISFVRDMDGIHDALQPRLDDSKQRELLARGFVGREWLTEMVANWLEDRESPRACLLTGSPGVGKSAFAAHFAHYGAHLRSSVAASLFCEANRPLYNDAHQVIRTVAYLLACRIPEYRTELVERIKGRRDLYEMNVDEIFSFLLADPLTRSIDGGHECLCIVIDGIDEAGDSGKNALADVFGRYAGRLPAWLKVLIVSRRVSAVTTPLSSGARCIDIDDASDLNDEDVRAYLSNTLNPWFAGDPHLDDAIDAIVDVSKGTMLYASVIADALVKGRAKLDEAIIGLPTGLSGSFYQWFRWTFRDGDEYKRDFRSALGCVLAAPGGALPENELHRVFGWDRDRIRDFERRLEVFLRKCESPLGGPALSISHAFLVEWLASSHAGEFQVSTEGGAETLAKNYFDALSDSPNLLTDYGAVHILDLLERTCFNDEYEIARNNTLLLARLRNLCNTKRDGGTVTLAERIASNAIEHFRGAKKLSAIGFVKFIDYEAFLLMELNRHSEAMGLLRENLETTKMLAEANRGSFASNYAYSLSELSRLLWQMGNYTESERLRRKSLDIYKELADSDPDAHLLDYAVSYNGLAAVVNSAGRANEAETLWREALRICREAVGKRPSAENESYLSDICNNLAILLVHKNRKDEAEELYREALEIRRRLTEVSPSKYLPPLARLRNNLGGLFFKAGRMEEAAECYREVIGIHRQLADAEPAVYLPYLAAECNNLAAVFHKIDRDEEAEAHYREALEIHRKLSESEPAVQLPYVAITCTNLANMLADRKEYKEAEMLYREAIGIRRKLAEAEPQAHMDQLAKTYGSLANMLSNAGRYSEAADLRHESIEIQRKFTEANPE